jgi:TMEM175 potassium channel family protein
VVSDRWGTGRTEAFSDGVFAIAITLLVLEISVPESDFEDLWKGIADQWPSYLGYATSFLTIGGLWLIHHGIFRRLASADAMVMRLNILLLMLVSFLPFPTKLVAEAIDLTSAERAAVIFYGLVLLSISVVIGALWRYVADHRHLLEPDVTDEDVSGMTLLTAPSMGFYVVVVLLALFAPTVAAFGYLVIAVVAVFRTRGDSAAASTPA